MPLVAYWACAMVVVAACWVAVKLEERRQERIADRVVEKLRGGR